MASVHTYSIASMEYYVDKDIKYKSICVRDITLLWPLLTSTEQIFLTIIVEKIQ